MSHNTKSPGRLVSCPVHTYRGSGNETTECDTCIMAESTHTSKSEVQSSTPNFMQKCSVSPKGCRGVHALPPPFPGLCPLMWSLECIKLFDVLNFHPPFLSVLGKQNRLLLGIVILTIRIRAHSFQANLIPTTLIVISQLVMHCNAYDSGYFM